MDEANKDMPIFKKHRSIIHEGRKVDLQSLLFGGYWMMKTDAFGNFNYEFRRLLKEQYSSRGIPNW